MQKKHLKTDQNNPAVRAYKKAVEKGKKNQHILPHHGKWAVTNLMTDSSRQVFTNRQDAIQYAEANANSGTAVFVHGIDGRIKNRIDF